MVTKNKIKDVLRHDIFYRAILIILYTWEWASHPKSIDCLKNILFHFVKLDVLIFLLRWYFCRKISFKPNTKWLWIKFNKFQSHLKSIHFQSMDRNRLQRLVECMYKEWKLFIVKNIDSKQFYNASLKTRISISRN